MGVRVLVLVTVSIWVAEVVPISVAGTVRLVGEKAMVGGGKVTVAVRGTLCGVPVASSVTTMLALRVPTPVGLRARVRVQLAPAANEAPQVLDWIENSLALGPANK